MALFGRCGLKVSLRSVPELTSRSGKLQRRLCAATALDEPPHQQDESRAYDGTDKTGFLTSVIPAKGLSEIGRDEGTENAKGCSENEALGLLLAGCNEFGDHSSNEANDDGPENTEHVLIPLKGRPTVW